MTKPTLEELATVALERFQADLMKLALSDGYQALPHVVITGCLEVAGMLARAGVQREPNELPTLLGQIDQLRDFVQSAVVTEVPIMH